jgi:osmotically-inducible protein OsmY
MRSFVKTLAVGAAAGAAVSYFYDPENGRRRRAVASDRFGAMMRKTGREAERKRRYYAGKTEGIKHAVTPSGGRDEFPNDATLQHKIESEVLRNFPKGSVNVNVEEGVAVLRGQLPQPDEINALVDAVRSVEGIVDVRSLLHLPGTPAPTWESATRRR